MGMLKKTIAVIALLLMVNLFFLKPHVALADQIPATKGKITEHDPKGRTTVEIDSPEKSGGKWLWALLGVAAIGGIAAVAGGGSSEGDDDDDDDPPATTGSFESTW